MGSRAVVILCRDEEVARKRFGVIRERDRHLLTRTGRRFFDSRELETQFLDRIREAADRALFWDVVKSDWFCLVDSGADAMVGQGARVAPTPIPLPSARRLALLFRKPLQVWSKQLLRILNSLSFATLLRACPARRAFSLLLIAATAGPSNP